MGILSSSAFCVYAGSERFLLACSRSRPSICFALPSLDKPLFLPELHTDFNRCLEFRLIESYAAGTGPKIDRPKIGCPTTVAEWFRID